MEFIFHEHHATVGVLLARLRPQIAAVKRTTRARAACSRVLAHV